MGSKQRVVYWDANIFLAWLNNEIASHPKEEMDGIQEQLTLLKKGQLHLATSVITFTEILESGVPTNARETLDKLFQRRNYHKIDVNSRITDISHEIRNYYQHQKAVDGLPTVTTPDAIHLATAIYFDCDTFHTFDEKDDARRGRRALIPLSGNVAGKYPLIIQKPRAMQLYLISPAPTVDDMEQIS